MRNYSRYIHQCPKCKTTIDVNKYFFDFTVFGDYYASDFNVCCEVCNYKFNVERYVLTTYEIKP